MKIEISGYIIGNEDQWIYDLFGIEATSPKKVSDQLKEALASGETVEVDIDSPGGYVTDGSKIYTMLMSHPTPVTINVVGMAASSASLIAMAGKPTRISPSAQIMIHNASSLSAGDYREHERNADVLKQVNRSLSNAYRLKTGLEESELLALMDKETYFVAQEAVEKGFADEVMFDSAGTLRTVASASGQGMIPQAVIDKMRAEMAQKKPAAQQQNETKNQPPAEPEQKEAPKAMNLEQFKAEHGELYAQIVAEAEKTGATSERTRIKNLNALAKAPGAAAVVAQAIEDGDTPEATAMKIVMASQERIEKVGADREKDAENSGASKVTAAASPEKDLTEEQQKELALAERFKNAAQAVNKQGGRI